ncbi:MAG: hypothetical protein C4547_06020 [Phycisphaerales bacterium]|nr:MAG: hypothetical protein C4547_06020 [Phycisphaerales bacterium]
MLMTPEPMAGHLTEPHEIGKQIEVELALVAHIERALLTALGWRTGGGGNIRKLSTLRFVARSFERHLTRLRVLSEYGGYMNVVLETKPHLASEVRSLKEARDTLHARLERIILRLEHVVPNDAAAFDALCAELERYLDDLSSHGHAESELLQHSFAQEEGGSG